MSLIAFKTDTFPVCATVPALWEAGWTLAEATETVDLRVRYLQRKPPWASIHQYKEILQKILRVKDSRSMEVILGTVIQSANLLTRKAWKSWGVLSAAGNFIIRPGAVRHSLSKATSDYLLSDTAVSSYLHWRKMGLCKGAWTHLNAVGIALVLPLSDFLLQKTGNCKSSWFPKHWTLEMRDLKKKNKQQHHLWMQQTANCHTTNARELVKGIENQD